MTTKFSTIFYTNLNDKGESFILPTIQSISIPDNTTIPSKPTITGEYRNQYVATSAVRVNFTVWLEAGHYGDETLDVSETLDHLVYLKKHRLLFNLITSHTEEESRFFTNLAIENISYSREAEHRNRLVCVINCVQRWLVNVTWSLASAVEIFGHEIFTDPNASTETINMDFVPGTTSEDFELSNSSVKDLFKKIGDISGFTDMPVTRHIRNEIENQVTLDKYSYYFKLGEPIDMSVGSRIYNCSCQFKSRYGLGTEDESYTVDLSKFTITVTKKDTSIEQNYPVAAILGASLGFDSSGLSEAGSRLAAKNNVLPTDRYMYDTTDTYKNANPPYTVSTSFEYIEKKDGLAKYLKTAKENGRFTTDKSAVSTGSVVVINDYVWSYKISNHYTFDVGYGSFKKTLTPDGGLKVDVFKLTQTDGFKITVSNEKRQADWDGIANSLSLVVVTLGTQIQLYLFSPVLFSMTKVAPAT